MTRDIEVLVDPSSIEILKTINRNEKVIRFVFAEKTLYVCDAYNTMHHWIMRRALGYNDVYDVVCGLAKYESGKWKVTYANKMSWVKGKSRTHSKITKGSIVALPHNFFLA